MDKDILEDVFTEEALRKIVPLNREGEEDTDIEVEKEYIPSNVVDNYEIPQDWTRKINLNPFIVT